MDDVARPQPGHLGLGPSSRIPGPRRRTSGLDGGHASPPPCPEIPGGAAGAGSGAGGRHRGDRPGLGSPAGRGRCLGGGYCVGQRPEGSRSTLPRCRRGLWPTVRRCSPPRRIISYWGEAATLPGLARETRLPLSRGEVAGVVVRCQGFGERLPSHTSPAKSLRAWNPAPRGKESESSRVILSARIAPISDFSCRFDAFFE